MLEFSDSLNRRQSPHTHRQGLVTEVCWTNAHDEL